MPICVAKLWFQRHVGIKDKLKPTQTSNADRPSKLATSALFSGQNKGIMNSGAHSPFEFSFTNDTHEYRNTLGNTQTYIFLVNVIENVKLII